MTFLKLEVLSTFISYDVCLQMFLKLYKLWKLKSWVSFYQRECVIFEDALTTLCWRLLVWSSIIELLTSVSRSLCLSLVYQTHVFRNTTRVSLSHQPWWRRRKMLSKRHLVSNTEIFFLLIKTTGWFKYWIYISVDHSSGASNETMQW